MLADKEVVMSALNIKSMSFDGADIVKLRDDIPIMVSLCPTLKYYF